MYGRRDADRQSAVARFRGRRSHFSHGDQQSARVPASARCVAHCRRLPGVVFRSRQGRAANGSRSASRPVLQRLHAVIQLLWRHRRFFVTWWKETVAFIWIFQIAYMASVIWRFSRQVSPVIFLQNTKPCDCCSFVNLCRFNGGSADGMKDETVGKHRDLQAFNAAAVAEFVQRTLQMQRMHLLFSSRLKNFYLIRRLVLTGIFAVT